jgi:hypothetical protein
VKASLALGLICYVYLPFQDLNICQESDAKMCIMVSS